MRHSFLFKINGKPSGLVSIHKQNLEWFRMWPGLLFLLIILLVGGKKALAASCLDGFSLYSSEQTILNDRVTVESGKTGSSGSVEIGVDGIAKGDFVAVGDILLRDRASVLGNATAGGSITLNSGAQVSGFIQESAPVQPCAVPEESFSTGSDNVNISNGNTVSLAPGNYGEVRVYSNSRLQLQTGTYRFSLLRTEADGEIEFNADAGTVEILVSTSLSFGDRSKFLFSGSSLPGRVKIYSGQTSTVYVGTDVNFFGSLQVPLGQVKAFSRTVFQGAVHAKSIDLEPDVVVHYVPLLTPGVELPDLYPPTYIPGHTTYLEACLLALDNSPLPEETEWVPSCSTAVLQDLFKSKVGDQIPGRDLGSNPPKIADMTVFPIDPPTSEGNALMEVEFAENLPDTVNFVWDGQVLTARDDGFGEDETAHDGIYSVVLNVNFESLPAPEEGEEGIPAPIFGREIVRQASQPTGEVDLGAKDIPEPLLQTCGNIHDPGPNCPMHPEKVFMLRDLDIVNNSMRTSDPCLVMAEGDPLEEARKKWTFGYLMTQMANEEVTGISPSEFVLKWLENWAVDWPPENEDLINNQELPNLESLFSTPDPDETVAGSIRKNWLAASKWAGAPDDQVLMELAPFRLLTIVNRLDLRNNEMFQGGRLAGGELRFVFTPLILPEPDLGTQPPNEPCNVMGFPGELKGADQTVILEYAVDLNTEDEAPVQNWAQAWADLDGYNLNDPLGIPPYLDDVEFLTERVVRAGRGDIFNRANGSALRQIRTNEAVSNSVWDLREFVIDDVVGVLKPTTVKNAPADMFNETNTLGQWIIENREDILSEDGHKVPETFAGNFFLGARTLNDASVVSTLSPVIPGFWQPAPGFLDYSDMDNRKARHKFSVNVCSACHGLETKDPDFTTGETTNFFAHVMPREYHEKSKLSNFLTGIPAFPALAQNPDDPVYVPDPVFARITLPNKKAAPINFRDLVWIETRYVVVGGDGFNEAVAATSPDGYTFNIHGMGTSERINAIAWKPGSPGQLVAVGGKGIIVTSNDGINWENPISIESEEDLYSVAWSDQINRFLAVGQEGAIFTSPDGINWDEQASDVFTDDFFAVTASDPLVAVGQNGLIATSPDGLNWTDQSLETTLSLHAVAVAPDQVSIALVAVGDDGLVAVSSLEGDDWTPLPPKGTNTTAILNAVTWTGNQWVAVGDGGAVIASPDGATWTPQKSRVPSNSSISSILWTGNELAMAGSNGLFLTDTDPSGSNWELGEFGQRIRYFEDLAFRLEHMQQCLSTPLCDTRSPAKATYRPSGRIH